MNDSIADFPLQMCFKIPQNIPSLHFELLTGKPGNPQTCYLAQGQRMQHYHFMETTAYCI